MYHLTVTLKQETPLLHFQHNQQNATLRASEVKPKLDKFIVKREFKNNFNECKEYLIGYCASQNDVLESKFNNNFRALDYKLKISAKGKCRKYIVASYMSQKKLSEAQYKRQDAQFISPSPYFAQENEYNKMQWGNLSKEGIMQDSIELIFTSRSIRIMEMIRDNIEVFVAAHNFGTRQSKGFGGFSVTDITDHLDKKKKLANYDSLLTENFLFVYKSKTRFNNLNEIFRTINNHYKWLKSGDAMKKSDSLLRQYFSRNNCNWEKQFIKHEYNKLNFPYTLEGGEISAAHNPKFIRALLGLPGNYEFLLSNPKTKKGKMVATVECTDRNIERFASPLIVKVHDGYIYFAGNEPENPIFGKEFQISCSISDDDRYNGRSIGNLYTPSEFSLRKFMHFAMGKINKYQEIKKNNYNR